ncbi:MAG: hypothetical protein QM760_20105 [Nibricoccus sp.]
MKPLVLSLKFWVRSQRYFEASVKLSKKVKSAMTYPIAVIGLAVVLVNVLLIFVIPVFAEDVRRFRSEGPASPDTDADRLLELPAVGWAVGSSRLYHRHCFLRLKYVATPVGRSHKDHFLVEPRFSEI